jgi:hypothetical protein
MLSPLFVATVATFIVACLWRWSLPRPIRGIPHNRKSSQHPFGDLPEFLNAQSSTGQIFPWMASQTTKLNSPIVQLFLRPLSKPWVILTDFRESQDILLRRTREFDRSDFLGDVFAGLVPEFHISKKSSDAKFKANRDLLKGLMTPGFLNEVGQRTSCIIINIAHLIRLQLRKYIRICRRL